MRLRQRQSWTVTREKPTPGALAINPRFPGLVKITCSDTGEVRRLYPGETLHVDATLFLTPMEGGWELLP